MRLSTDGLIIRAKNAGESNRLIVALTRERGLITAYVQGARKLKNRNASSTGLLCYSNITFFKSKDTYRVDEASTVEIFFNLRSDIVKLSLAEYFCELSLCLAPEESGAEDFLRLMLNSLHYLSTGGRSEKFIKSVVEMRMLSMSGYMPDLLACNRCGAFEGDTMYLDPVGGSLYCEACKPVQNLLPLNRSVLAAMRHLVYSDSAKLFHFTLPDAGIEQLNQATERYTLIQTGRTFKTLDFYHTL